jgi:hypothetical protein
MSAEIIVKLKLANGKTIELDGKDAKKVFEDLKEIYGEKISYFPYSPYYPIYVDKQPEIFPQLPYYTTCGTSSISQNAKDYNFNW